jgi:hypothetical protein
MKSFTSNVPCVYLRPIVIFLIVEIEETQLMQRVALIVVDSLELDGRDCNLEKFIADKHLALR